MECGRYGDCSGARNMSVLRPLLGSFALALALVACTAAPGSPDEEGSDAITTVTADSPMENPDKQSPGEISAAKARIARDFGSPRARSPSSLSATERAQVQAKYAYLDPNHLVPADLLATATAYFDQNKASFPNQKYITVVDFKPRSDAYRFYLVSMADGSVERYHTTHGQGSDPNETGYAESFGNVEGSGKSSLGFVRTAEVYVGTYKRSVRLDGLSDTNSNIRERAVVFHGWDGVHEANVIQGLSEGCIALDYAVKDGVLDKIKEGSLMYVGVAGT
jgi:hypothetical protein